MFSVPDAADPPGAPVCDDVTDSSVHLVWKPPAFDGGTKIIKYIVEKREVKPDDFGDDDDWDEVMETPECEANLYDLDTGKEFEFRIRAVNEVGKGDPSDPSEKTKIELPKSKSEI